MAEENGIDRLSKVLQAVTLAAGIVVFVVVKVPQGVTYFFVTHDGDSWFQYTKKRPVFPFMVGLSIGLLIGHLLTLFL